MRTTFGPLCSAGGVRAWRRHGCGLLHRLGASEFERDSGVRSTGSDNPSETEAQA